MTKGHHFRSTSAERAGAGLPISDASSRIKKKKGMDGWDLGRLDIKTLGISLYTNFLYKVGLPVVGSKSFFFMRCIWCLETYGVTSFPSLSWDYTTCRVYFFRVYR